MTHLAAPRWTDKIIFDLALLLEGSGDSVDQFLKDNNITKADLTLWSDDPVFNAKITKYRDEIRENGMTFRLKARAQAEDLLTTSWNLIHSHDVSPAVKADLIKATVKWGGLEPKENQMSGDGGGGVKITINLPSTAQTPEPIPQTLDITPIKIGQAR